MTWLDQLTPALLVAGVMTASVVLYALTGGADFGGGVWDLLATGPRRKAQQRAIERAIAPVWEANHVWLIIAVVLLFVCFPKAYAAIGTALHIPVTAMLVGVILRGTAFTFRAYDTGEGASERAKGWTRVFAITSTVTPVMLGVIAGAVAAGGLTLDAEGRATTDFISAWWAPFPFVIGALTLALFAQLAAVYLALAHDGQELAEDFRLRALLAGGLVFILAWVAWMAAETGAPQLKARLLAGHGAWVVHGIAGGAGLLGFVTLWRRRYGWARAAVMLQTTAILLGQAWGQHPFVLPPNLTITAAAAPDSVLVPVLWALLAGSVVLVPAYWALYRVFRTAGRQAGD
ncbi:MAG: cytochrome d ubiquinol oxidase subunit II [Myxococcales bacterium]|nr:cytochrome d ubiquinol oxidase subunit II [Myxococcales bacterium]